VERWAEIRRLYWVKHLSQRAIHAKGVPRYCCPPRPSILDPYKPFIEALLREERRLSAVRIKEQLEAEGYHGGITILRDYLVQVRPRFLPPPAYQRSEYLPGAIGQVDWAEMPDRGLQIASSRPQVPMSWQRPGRSPDPAGVVGPAIR